MAQSVAYPNAMPSQPGFAPPGVYPAPAGSPQVATVSNFHSKPGQPLNPSDVSYVFPPETRIIPQTQQAPPQLNFQNRGTDSIAVVQQLPTSPLFVVPQNARNPVVNNSSRHKGVVQPLSYVVSSSPLIAPLTGQSVQPVKQPVPQPVQQLVQQLVQQPVQQPVQQFVQAVTAQQTAFGSQTVPAPGYASMVPMPGYIQTASSARYVAPTPAQAVTTSAFFTQQERPYF